MNQHPRSLSKRLIIATYKLELEPKGNGYDILVTDHAINLDHGAALDLPTHLIV